MGLDNAMTENGVHSNSSIPTSWGDMEWIFKMEAHGHLDLHFRESFKPTYPSSKNGVNLYFGQSFKLNHPSRKYGMDLHFGEAFKLNYLSSKNDVDLHFG